MPGVEEEGAAPLRNHRRAFLYALGLLVAMFVVFVAVGRHPGVPGTTTTWPAVGRFDHAMYRGVDRIWNTPLTWIAKTLNVVGGGAVTIPLRAVVAIYLLVRRRWRAFAVWVLTWVVAEVGLTVTKAWMMRTRPEHPLVSTKGYSFPSGHAVAAAAIAVALVLVTMPSGPRRRKWELIAVAVSFVMAMSRVYLNAHWFSDVVAGVLLGTGIALGSAAFVTEIRDLVMRNRAARPGEPATEPSQSR